MFPTLDPVIAFVVLMLVASLFITAVTQVVVSLLGLRGVNLQRGLVDLFETAYPDQEARRWAKEIARRVLRHPTISDSIFSRFSLRVDQVPFIPPETAGKLDRKSTRLNSSHGYISYAVFCLKKKKSTRFSQSSLF